MKQPQTQAQQPQVANQAINEPVIDLKVSIQTLNTIIGALDEMPHKVSRFIIDDLGQQARAQLQPPTTTTVPDGPLSDRVVQ